MNAYARMLAAESALENAAPENAITAFSAYEEAYHAYLDAQDEQDAFIAEACDRFNADGRDDFDSFADELCAEWNATH